MMEKLRVEGKAVSFLVKLEDNVATRALVERLKKGDIEVTVSDYGGFEKVGSLGFTLPSADRQLTMKRGDVALYTSDNIVFFLGSNSWAYTKLGHIEGEAKLPSGKLTLKLSLAL